MSALWRVLFTNGRGAPQVWLRGSLSNGQCFSWTLRGAPSPPPEEEEVWEAVVGTRLVRLKQRPFNRDDKFLHPVYLYAPDDDDGDDADELLHRYFRTEVDLEALYAQWGERCHRFAAIADQFRGIRLLRQDKLECILSFITSSNNNIKRIHSLLDKFRQEYGTKLNDATEEEEEGSRYAFPTLGQLLVHAENDGGFEARLRALGFGYRAKYIAETVRLLGDKECKLLDDDDDDSTSDALTQELCKLTGVGRKVADCISLFAYDRLAVVPVDVHVLRIAQRDYNEDGQLDSQAKTLTKPMYAKVHQAFYSRFGEHAGWAHSVLFTCELGDFRERLGKDMLREMDAYKLLNKKKNKKEEEEEEDSSSSSEEEAPPKRRRQQR